ncbi:hypothetical protein VWO06_09410, partial [Campylobacter coli]
PVFVLFLGIVLAVIFGIGSEKEAFKNVPWDLIFMIGSLSMLIRSEERSSKARVLTIIKASFKDLIT